MLSYSWIMRDTNLKILGWKVTPLAFVQIGAFLPKHQNFVAQ